MRITPTNHTVDSLRDWEPYEAELAEFSLTEGAAQYGGELRLQVSWLLEDGTSLRDWMALRLGQRQGGGVSKLRGLLNALAGRPESDRIEWFDTDTWAWSYDGQHPQHHLAAGQRVILRGRKEERPDGEGLRFRVVAYQPAVRPATAAPSPARPKVSAAPAPRPAPQVVSAPTPRAADDDGSIPF